MRLRTLTVACILAGATALTVGSAGAAHIEDAPHGGKPLSTTLLPGNETPPLATNASGFAPITANAGHSEVCWHITFSNLSGPAVAAHIHVAPPGVSGRIVSPTPVPSEVAGTGNGCAVVHS